MGFLSMSQHHLSPSGTVLMGPIKTFQEKKKIHYKESLTGLEHFIAFKVFLYNVLSVDWNLRSQPERV